MFSLEKFERGAIVFLTCTLLLSVAFGYFRSLRPPLPVTIRRGAFYMDDIRRKVDINKASAEELTTLNGVGESMAERIVAYRQENGLFGSAEEIKNVKGIGDKFFDNIKDSITVE